MPNPANHASTHGDECSATPFDGLGMIAVVGLACRFAGAPDVQAFWRLLLAGREGLRALSDSDLRAAGLSDQEVAHPGRVKVSGAIESALSFDARFFGYSPEEAALLDPQHRLFLESCWHALEDAGPYHSPSGLRIGVYGGVAFNTYLLTHLAEISRTAQGPERWRLGMANDKDTAISRVAYKLGLTGPALGVQTACSSSLVAVHLACQAILDGDCDMALAGGAGVHFPQDQGYLHYAEGVESRDGHCRPFSSEASGTVFSDGVGVVVLRRHEDAVAAGDRIYACILGSAVNNDAADKVGFTAPSVNGQADVISTAQAVAGIRPDQVAYVEAHGTGTAVGDAIELKALTQVFGESEGRQHPCLIGAVKSNIGHADTAAGIAGLIKTSLCLYHDTLAPSLHVDSAPSMLPGGGPFALCGAAQAWPATAYPPIAGISSFGIGGTNAHVILQQAHKADSRPRSHRKAQLIPLWGPNQDALQRQADQVIACFESADADGPALAHAFQQRPACGTLRRALLIGPGRNGQGLRHLVINAPMPIVEEAGATWLFPGQGSQVVGMAYEHYHASPCFAQTVDSLLALLDAGEAALCRAMLLQTPDGQATAADLDSLIDRCAYTHLVLFIHAYALAMHYRQLGVKPRALLGHSLGELTAAAVAGVWSPADALALVRLRGRLLERTPAAAMMAVQADQDLRQFSWPPGITLACINGPRLFVLCGAEEALQTLLAQWPQWHAVRLRGEHAFHSPAVEPAVAPLLAFLRGLKFQVPQFPLLSCVSGDWMTPEQACDPMYWAEHLRLPVRFAEAAHTLLSAGAGICQEIGPGKTLIGLMARQADRGPLRVVASCTQDEPDTGGFGCLRPIAELWLAGVDIHWSSLHTSVPGRASIPPYPFARQHLAYRSPDHRLPAPEESPFPAHLQRVTWHQAVQRRGSTRLSSLLIATLAPLPAETLQWLSSEAEQFQVWTHADAGSTPPRPPGGQEQFFDFTQAAQWQGALASLAGTTLHRVLCYVDRLGPGALDFETSLRCALGFARALALRLTQPGNAGSHTVHWLSRNLFAVDGSTPSPDRQALWGVARVLPQELAGVRSHVHDIEGGQDAMSATGLTTALQRSLCSVLDADADAADFTIQAWRRGRLWLPRLEDVTALLQPTEGAQPAIRHRGSYLITGGAGGIGRVIAAWLSSSYQARVLLCGRRPEAELQDWDVFITAHPSVTYVQANVTEEAQLARLGPGLHGVFHCAGLAGEGLIAVKTDAHAQAVCAPKVGGTRAILRAYANTPLDFVVLFSSVNAWFGGWGQAEYAGANAYMEAQAGRSDAPWRLIAMAWDSWTQTGMAYRRYGNPGRLPDPAEGPRHELALPRQHWLFVEHHVDGVAVLPGTASLALLLQAAQTQSLSLQDLAWLRPVRMPMQDELRLQVHGEPGGAGLRLALLAGDRTVCTALARPEDLSAKAAQQAAGALRNAFALEGSETPRVQLSPRLQLGPRWDCMADLRSSGDCYRLELRQQAVAQDFQEWPWHPALIDVALLPLQLCAHAFSVPASVEQVWAAPSLVSVRFSYVRIRERSTEHVLADVCLADERGDPQLWLGGIRFVVLPQGAMVAPPFPGNPPQLQGLSNAAALWALKQTLEACDLPAITVSSQEPLALRQRLDGMAQALRPAPRGDDRSALNPASAPGTSVLERFCALIAAQLGYASVEPSTNYFALGGDSLSGLQLISSARELGVSLSLASLYRAATIADLCDRAGVETVERARAPRFALVPENDRRQLPPDVVDAFPLSALQQGIAYYRSCYEGQDIYRDLLWADLQGPFDPELMSRAWAQCVQRHEVLRTEIDSRHFSVALQMVRPSAEVGVSVHDLDGLTVQRWARDSRLKLRTAHGPAARPFVLLGESRFHVLLLLDDALLDGWSATSLLAELLGNYAALLEGRSMQTQPLALSFHDYVSHEQAMLHDPDLVGFWRQALHACEPSQLVRNMGAGQRGQGQAPPSLRICIEHVQTFSPDLVERIAAAHGCTPKIVLLAAYLRGLSLFCGTQEVTTGLETHTRLEANDGAMVLGLHLNTLPMRYRFRPMPLRDYLASVAECESALMAHRHLPLSAIQQDWDVPLFDNCFNYTHFRGLHQAALGNALQLHGYHGEERTHYPFKLWVDREAAHAGYALYLAFDEERLAPEQARAMGALFGEILTGLDGAPGRCVSDLAGTRPMAAPLAQQAPAAPGADVTELFDAACRRHAQQIALHHGDQRCTYAQLAHDVQCAMAGLQEEALAPGDVVGLLLPRSFWWVASVWAILKINATVLLLDAQAPMSRILETLQSAAVRLLVCEQETAAALRAQGGSTRTLEPRGLFGARDARGRQPAPSAPHPSSAAYLIFTSGSTGKSKAVVGTRLGLNNRVRWQLEHYPMGVGDVGLLRTASAFVDVFWELLGPLCAGASLVVADDADQRDSSRLLSLTRQHAVTHWVLVPTLLEELLQHLERDRPPLDLRQVSVSGELLRPALILRAQTVLPQVRWINLYGSSEVTADVAALAIEGALAAEMAAAPSVPVGWPISQTGLHLLDDELLPVEPGRQGELYVSGASLAHGYLGQAALSAQRFVPNPWSTGGHDCRLFRTGDLAVQGRHGLEILGRRDRQIKQRGVRIDLDGLEARLVRLPGVERCAIEQHENGLQAYLQCAPGCDLNALWPAMRDSLLAQERPGQVRLLDQMPLTASGKINRMALHEAACTRLELRGNPLQGEQQMQLAALWREVLPDAPDIFAESRFDELGGHSLLLLQLGRLIERKLGVRLGMAALLAAPTLQQQASLLRDGVVHTAVVPAFSADTPHRDRPFKPTPLQQAYWVSRHTGNKKADGGSHLYQEWMIPGLDTHRLSTAWNQLIARHAVLRAVFDEDGMMRIENQKPYALRETDLREQAPEARLQAHREQQLQQPLDPGHGPLFDLQVFRLSDEQALFTVKLDFLIVDAWSAAILARELWALYHHPNALLPDLDISFRDVQNHIERDPASLGARATAEAYWAQRLAQLPAAPDLPLRQGTTTASSQVLRREHILDARAKQRLAALAEELGLSLSSLMLAAYAGVLQRWSNQKAFTLTLTLFDRPPLHPHVNRLVGDFTTVLLLEVAGAHAPDFFAFARALHARLLQDLDHRQYSGISVARTLNQQSGGLDAMRYVYTSIVQAGDAGALAFPEGSVQTLRMTRTAGVWIDNQVVGEGDGLRLHWDCLDGVFPDGLVADMFASYCGLVDELVEGTASDKPAPRLPSAQWQRRQVKQPVLTAPVEDYLALIAKRCAEHGAATAVIAADRELSYRQLWWEASRLSEQLRQGARGAECVAVQLPTGWRQVIAVLAIQLAGLPYVPLSMRWPAARREQIMREHGMRHLVTQGDLARPAIEGLMVFDLAGEGAQAPADFQPRSLRQDHDAAALAYIIFTSGSTGSPKGVMMQRGAVQNTLNDLRDRLRLGPSDRVLGLSDLAFDLSVFDIFGVLMSGSALVLPEPSEQPDPSAWWQLCQRHGVTIWNSVPAMFELLADYAAGKTGRLGTLPLRWVMLSGDWIPLPLPAMVTSLAPQARLLSLGGATEAGIWSVSYPVPKVRPEWRSVPYGLPLSNQSCKVVDACGLSCPEWVVGELLIGGRSLSSGYWHRPELSAAAFGPDAETGERHYRTGDLARYRSDGVLELIGRNDTQVKVSGHRVECMEVEHVVASCPGVARAAVLAIKGRLGHELHAVVEAPPNLAAAEIQAYCRTHLPDWMQPRQWHRDISFALNDNGKIDRRRLHAHLQTKLHTPSN